MWLIPPYSELPVTSGCEEFGGHAQDVLMHFERTAFASDGEITVLPRLEQGRHPGHQVLFVDIRHVVAGLNGCEEPYKFVSETRLNSRGSD